LETTAALSMKRGGRDIRGFTLIELIIVLFLMSLVAGAVYSIFYTSLKAYWKGDINTQVQASARQAIDQIARDVRQSRIVLPALNEGGFQFDNKCLPSTPQLSLSIPQRNTMTLDDGTTIFGTYISSPQGVLQAGEHVSWYLASTNDPSNPASLTPNLSGPYLMRHVWHLGPGTPAGWTQTIATNVTFLGFGTSPCPSYAANTREITITLTTSQTAAGQGVSSTDTVTTQAGLRTPNQSTAGGY